MTPILEPEMVPWEFETQRHGPYAIVPVAITEEVKRNRMTRDLAERGMWLILGWECAWAVQDGGWLWWFAICVVAALIGRVRYAHWKANRNLAPVEFRCHRLPETDPPSPPKIPVAYV